MAVPLDSAGRPQPYHHQDDGTTEEKLHGRNNAHYATLKDDLGNVVDTTNRLPVDSVLSGSSTVGGVDSNSALVDTNGNLLVSMGTRLDKSTDSIDTELPTARVAADGLALPTAPDVLAQGMLYNGSTLDMERANVEVTALASAARTASTDSGTRTNHNACGIIAVLSVTAASGTGGLLLTFSGVDSTSGTSYQLTPAPTAVTATGTYAYELSPGADGAVPGNGMRARTAGRLPRSFKVSVTHSDASSYTYSVSYVLLTR